DAGLMPTIAEDVATEEDIYSYKSRLTGKLDRFTDKLNPAVVSAGQTVFMAPKTRAHRFLSQTTQLSDFVARYALYQHMTNRKRDTLSHEEAVHRASDAFINYDIPMPKGIQYLDDVGLMYFTKYLMRVQRVIAQMVRENPG